MTLAAPGAPEVSTDDEAVVIGYLIANILQPLIDIANSVLVFLHDLGLVYGAAIVALTFITRAAILPLSVKQIRSMREMSALQPQIKEIQEQVQGRPPADAAGDDGSSTRRTASTRSPPACRCCCSSRSSSRSSTCCRATTSRRRSREAGEQSWLFINDLTEKATGSELIILLALYIGTSLIAGLIMTGRNASAQQRMIALGLPLVFTPIMIGFPAGLLVYWISTNVWTMGQQAVVKVFFPGRAEPADAGGGPGRPRRLRLRRARRSAR